MVLIIYSALRFILRYCPTGGKLDPAVSLEYAVLQKKKIEFCVNCQHAWHLVCTDETDDPFYCLNCRGLGKHK